MKDFYFIVKGTVKAENSKDVRRELVKLIEERFGGDTNDPVSFVSATEININD